MVIVFDIGNTEIDIGLFAEKDDQLAAQFELITEPNKTEQTYAQALKLLLERNRTPLIQIQAAVIGSVVPSEKAKFVTLCREMFHLNPFIAVSSVNTVIPIRYDPLKSVGIDRIANAVAAIEYYPPPPFIIVDLGTATTFTVVSEAGEFIGGAITTGIQTAIYALHQETAQLPSIELNSEIIQSLPTIGTDTITNLQSGFYYGFVDLVDGLVSRMAKKLNTPSQVIATGGFAPLIAAGSKTIQKTDGLLTLKGLFTIFRKNEIQK